MPNYLIYNEDRSHIAGPITCADDAEAAAIAMHLGPGATFEVAEVTPVVLTPAEKLAKDAVFGQEVLNEFLASAKTANLPLNLAEALRAKLEKVHYYLQIGSIGTALEALQVVEPNVLFPAATKQHYVSILQNYMN